MLAQEVENLQNDGFFRLKLLGAIERQTTATREQTKTLTDFAEALFEKLDAMGVPMTSEEANKELIEAGEREIPKQTKPQVEEDDSDSDFELPPLNLSKKK